MYWHASVKYSKTNNNIWLIQLLRIRSNEIEFNSRYIYIISMTLITFNDKIKISVQTYSANTHLENIAPKLFEQLEE